MGRDFRGGRGDFRGGDRGGRGGGRGGRSFDQGPPQRVDPLAQFSHVCGNQIVVKSLSKTQVPKFFRPVYFENMQQIGKVDEIFGPIDNYLYSVTLDQGVDAKSFKANQKIYLNPYDTLPMDKFLPRPKGSAGASRGVSRGRGGPSRGPSRGGPSRGGPPRGRGGNFSRGGPPRGRGGNNNFGRGGFKR